MRRIFPSILSPGAGASPLKEEDGLTATQDKEVVSAPRPKSPSRPKSPFKWGRSSVPDAKPKTKRSPTAAGKQYLEASPKVLDDTLPAIVAARRLAHPGRSSDPDFSLSASRSSTLFEDDCEDKQVLTVRASSPTSYFQSAHKMRASLDAELRSTADSGRTLHYDLALSPQQIYSDESLKETFKQKAKRYNSAPKLRMPFSGDSKASSPAPGKQHGRDIERSHSTTRQAQVEPGDGPLTLLANLVQHWQSPGRGRNGHARSSSRGSDSFSVASNSESSSFRDKSSTGGDADENVPYKFRRDSSTERQVKYRSARSVAERLAKVIRGSSAKTSPKEPEKSADSGQIVKVCTPKEAGRALKSYFTEEVADNDVVLEFQPGMDSGYLSYSTGQLKSIATTREVFPIEKRRQLVPDPKEQEELDMQISHCSENINSMYDRAEDRAREAEQKLEVLQEELDSFELRFRGEDSDSEEESSNLKVKKLMEEKVSLARDSASEAKLCVMDYHTVREGWSLMQRKLEVAAAVSEGEKYDLQAALEDELRRREADWIARLEKAQMEETRLKGRVREIAENNVGLQKEMASMAAKEKGLREQIRQYERQLETQKKKVAEADKVILEIRESSVTSRKHSLHAEDEMKSLKKVMKEKDEENTDLRRLVSRLQQLCTNHERSIQGLWNGLKNVGESKTSEKDKAVMRLQTELLRLSNIEQALRRDLETSNREGAALRRELKSLMDTSNAGEKDSLPKVNSAELDKLKTQLYELQEHNEVLSLKLGTALKDEKAKSEAVCDLEARNKRLLDEKAELQDEMARRKAQLQDKDKDCKWLETRLQAVVKTNRLLQGIVAKQAAFGKKETDEDAEDMQCDIQKCMEVSAEQLTQLNERIELVNDKLLERESELFSAKADSAKKDITIQGLEQNLSETKKTLEARVQRLTGRNEELFRLYNAKESEVAELQAKVKDEAEVRKKRELELEQAREQTREVQEELKVQSMHCSLLREKLCAREMELDNQDAEAKKSVEDRDVLQKDTRKLQMLLEDAGQRVIGLEKKLAEKEEQITWLQSSVNESLQNMSKLKDELNKTRKERDVMHREAEDLGTEALRASAEVEVLRRKVIKLEEDIMLKEGELSILQSNLDD